MNNLSNQLSTENGEIYYHNINNTKVLNNLLDNMYL